MRVVVSGSTGLIGSALVPALQRAGHQVQRLLRRRPAEGSGDLYWQPADARLDPSQFEGVDAVINLSGENLAQRWTDSARSRIRESRVRSTELLSRALTMVRPPPSVLISASAVGIYGSRGDELLDERSTMGNDFLADVAREWEGASRVAASAGIRVVNTRSGVVLTGRGGMLGRILPVFRLGVGGRIGSGRQWLSWVALPDEVGVLCWLLERHDISGPVNVASPEPVTNEEFTRVLGRALGRPTVMAVPAFAVKLAFGEMGESTILASQRVIPRRLLEAGYTFRLPRLEDSLREAVSEG